MNKSRGAGEQEEYTGFANRWIRRETFPLDPGDLLFGEITQSSAVALGVVELGNSNGQQSVLCGIESVAWSG